MTSSANLGDLQSEKSGIPNSSVSANHSFPKPVYDSDDDSAEGDSPSNSEYPRGIRGRFKAKTKKLLRIDNTTTSAGNTVEDGETQPLSNFDHDPVFNTSRLDKQKHAGPSATARKTKEVVKTIGSAIAHPKDATKGTITETTAGQVYQAERPYLSQKADLDFIEAHDKLKQLESDGPLREGSTGHEQDAVIGKHKDKLREMEAHRESLRAAWTTSRHIRRVRVVPKRHFKLPETEFFVERDANGNFVRYDWLTWLGYNLIYYTQDFCAQYIDDVDQLPFNAESLRHYTERLLMASAPWQSWLMKVRSVYRWEDPKTTGKWCALYIFLWYTNHIGGFLYFYIIYIVIKNRLYPSSVETLRSSLQRAQDSRSTAYKLSELIDKHGQRNWVEPILVDVGPYLQLQLGDVANLLEVFWNFYHWKSPRKTTATLIFFTSCLLVSLFADMKFCMKIVYFIAGGSFFLCFPISSRYPKYRYLVSPLKWVLWDIPTDAEWSFQYLRGKGQEARERMIEQRVEQGHVHRTAQPPLDSYNGRLTTIYKVQAEGDASEEESRYESDDSDFVSASSTTSILESGDIQSFRAFYNGHSGRFIIFSSGIRFLRAVNKKEMWRYSFVDLVEMRKIEGKRVSEMRSYAKQIEISWTDGSKLNIGLKERDEAFNTVIGFSSVQWQSLQTSKNNGEQDQR